MQPHHKDALLAVRGQLTQKLHLDMYSPVAGADDPEAETMRAFHEHMKMVRAVQAIDVATGYEPSPNEYDTLRNSAVEAIEQLGPKAEELLRSETFIDTAKVVGVYTKS